MRGGLAGAGLGEVRHMAGETGGVAGGVAVDVAVDVAGGCSWLTGQLILVYAGDSRY